MLTNDELLEKATTTTGDFGGEGAAALSIEQATDFISLLAANQVLLPEVRTVMSNASKWQEALLDFGGRVTRPGTEGARLKDQERAKPLTRMIEISTVLLRAEVPVSDEVMEDNIANRKFGTELEALIADQVGFDIEELLLNGDEDSGDEYLAQLDGWRKQLVEGGQVTDASGFASYQHIFKNLVTSIPNRFKRNKSDFRLYVPVILEELYRDRLAARNTDLGDVSLTQARAITYQGVPIVGVPALEIDGSEESSVILAHRNNLIAGFRRSITIESFRDPREGATSFICTARVDAKVGVPEAAAIATNVNVDPDAVLS